MKKITKVFLSICIILLIPIAAAVFVAGAYVYKNYKELPDIEKMVSTYTSPVPTTIYDRNGVLIDSIYREQREPIKISEIGDNIKKAFLAIEDKTFYSHHGINIRRNIGSIIVNISEGRSAQGASTITQQLAKNAFLSSEKKLSRKVKEMLITFKIERTYTKDEIFEKYLNEIYFGGGAYGIKSAAEQFFRKEVKDLSIAEAAMLAGIPNRPERYNPRRSLEDSLKRTHLVLKEMRKDNSITEEEYQEALLNKFEVLSKESDAKKLKNKNFTYIYPRIPKTESAVPDFTDLVVDFLKNAKDEKGERIFEDERIYSEGLKVYTTLDLEIQKVAKDVFENNILLKSRKGLQTGMATIDSSSGEIISIIGGINYKSGNFNRGSMAKRQLGSSSKPFLYFTALTNGAEMNTVIDDSKVKFGTWEPKNFNNKYYGSITLVEALDKSLNMVSIKLLQKVGVDALKETISNLGVNFKLPNNLTASLGAYEGTPLEMAQAYSVFSNGGYSIKPIMIRTVEDKNGNIVYASDIKKEKKYDSIDVSLITYMLESSVRNGTSKRAEVKTPSGELIDQGGKTGTTNESRTIWFAGITPKYVTTIYLGYDDNKPIQGNMTGGSGPAPIWGEFYTKLVEKGLYKPEKFEFIDNNVKNGVLVTQMLNPKTGFISSSEGREFLIRSGKIVLETDAKYYGGISALLRNKNFEPQVNNSYIDNADPISNQTTAPKNQIENVNIDNSDDSIMKKLLGN